MNLALLAVMLFLFGCAGTAPSRSAPSSASSNESRARGSFDSDVIDCERQAAVATIGGKGEAFSSCMKSRGHAPGR
jgi:hypothetical protein